MPLRRRGRICRGVFVFFSNKLGCAGSLAVSAILSLILIFAMRACYSGGGAP